MQNQIQSTNGIQLVVSRIQEAVASGQNGTQLSQTVEDIVWVYFEESFSQFPLPFVLVLVGYSLILLIDKVITDTHSGHESDHHANGNKEILENPF